MKRFVTSLAMALCITLLAVSAPLAGELNLSVAASLRETMNELADAFAKKHPDVNILKNYGASGALAKQIESGAPTDLFLSANVEWMDYLKERRLVEPSSIGTFAYNTLVFAGTTTQKIAGLKDLVKLQRIAIGSPKSVPAGEYALEGFRKAGVEKELSGKLVMAKDVREAMKYAELGEVDGAFVYRTDALLLGRQTKILFTVPEGLHDRVTYPMALTITGAKKGEAQEFLRFLRSAEAKNVLAKYGFPTK
ncbi:MAG: molybdate transport system substrate-binding [Geobacteraceae bacterium]|nr:MAG: molybdate transport system substrate-binding [Geobacteraceae bacterium]